MNDPLVDLELVRRALARGAGVPLSDEAANELDAAALGTDVHDEVRRTTQLLVEGSADIRVIARYLELAFVTRGPVVLNEVFDLLRLALGDAWANLGPGERKAKTVDCALRSCLRGIVSRWGYESVVRGALSAAWAEMDVAGVQRTLEASEALRQAAPVALERPTFPEQLSELDARLRATLERLRGQAIAAPPAATVSIEVSPAMAMFVRKLQAFAGLVERGDMARAAIVADDVRRILDSFDPRLYFPGLLRGHFDLLDAHLAELETEWERSDSPEWRIREQRYHVDLDDFIGG